MYGITAMRLTGCGCLAESHQCDERTGCAGAWWHHYTTWGTPIPLAHQREAWLAGADAEGNRAKDWLAYESEEEA